MWILIGQFVWQLYAIVDLNNLIGDYSVALNNNSYSRWVYTDTRLLKFSVNLLLTLHNNIFKIMDKKKTFQFGIPKFYIQSFRDPENQHSFSAALYHLMLGHFLNYHCLHSPSRKQVATLICINNFSVLNFK